MALIFKLKSNVRRRLYEIYKESSAHATQSPFILGINRADYLIEQDDKGQQLPLMVEMNTIACAHVQGTSVGNMHRVIGTNSPDHFVDDESKNRYLFPCLYLT